MVRFRLPTLAFLLVVFTNCAPSWHTRMTPEERTLADQIGGDRPDADFLRIVRLEASLRARSEWETALAFLRSPLVLGQSGPYGGWFLYLAARNLHELGQVPLAAHYFRRLDKHYPDLLYQGKTLRQRVLEYLAEHVSDPYERLKWLRQLLALYGTAERPPKVAYTLARTYAEIGNWPLAIQAYTYTLSLPSARTQLDRRTLARIRSLTTYSNAPRTGLRSNLRGLITEVREGVTRGNIEALGRLQAPTDFIIQYWAQVRNPHPPPDQETFLRDFVQFTRNSYGDSVIRWEDEPHAMSNANEAFLRTTNWNAEWRSVYFYFRRVYFPPEPDIHGTWVWAGVYLGAR